MKFSIKDFFSKCDQIRGKPADLVTFTEETRNGKLHFLCMGYPKNPLFFKCSAQPLCEFDILVYIFCKKVNILKIFSQT